MIQGRVDAHPARALAPSALVIHGDGVSTLERRAAKRVAELLRFHGGSPDNLLSESDAMDDTMLLAARDLVIVGQPHAVPTIRDNWSHWAWLPGLAGEQPPYYLPAGATFFLFGVGGFDDPHVGYVYSDRNPYNRRAETRARTRDAQPPANRLMLVVTGMDSVGVSRAASAFLETGLLNGVVSSDTGRIARLPFEVAPPQLSTAPPSWFKGVDAGRVQWAGWHQCNALDYSGLTEAAGVAPVRMWRLQYSLAPQLDHKSPNWHRQFSDMEVLIAEMPSQGATATACASLREALGEEWRQVRRGRGTTWEKHLPDGPFHVCSCGPYLLLETLPSPQDAQVVRAILQQIP